MSIHREKLDWCLAKPNRMKRIKPNDRLSMEHIEKAKHNLKAADYNIKGGFSDCRKCCQKGRYKKEYYSSFT